MRCKRWKQSCFSFRYNRKWFQIPDVIRSISSGFHPMVYLHFSSFPFRIFIICIALYKISIFTHTGEYNMYTPHNLKLSTTVYAHFQKFAMKWFQCIHTHFVLRNRTIQSCAQWPIFSGWFYGSVFYGCIPNQKPNILYVCDASVIIYKYIYMLAVCTVTSILNIFGHVSHCWHPAKYLERSFN